MPAIIVESILWFTLFLVGVLRVLTWIVFNFIRYLVLDIFLLPVFSGKLFKESVLFYSCYFFTADTKKMLICKLFLYFSFLY